MAKVQLQNARSSSDTGALKGSKAPKVAISSPVGNVHTKASMKIKRSRVMMDVYSYCIQ